MERVVFLIGSERSPLYVKKYKKREKERKSEDRRIVRGIGNKCFFTSFFWGLTVKLWWVSVANFSFIGVRCSRPKDSYTHLTKFYKMSGILGALKPEEVTVLMRVFPHSLMDKAKEWYLHYKHKWWPTRIHWRRNSLIIFFPWQVHGRQNNNRCIFLRCNWTSVWSVGKIQIHVEEMYEPRFGWSLANTHFHKWTITTEVVVGCICRGSLMSKSIDETISVIEQMVLSDHHASTKLIVDTNSRRVDNEIAKLPQQLKEMREAPKHGKIAFRELCSGDHPTRYCPPLMKSTMLATNKGLVSKLQLPKKQQF